MITSVYKRHKSIIEQKHTKEQKTKHEKTQGDVTVDITNKKCDQVGPETNNKAQVGTSAECQLCPLTYIQTVPNSADRSTAGCPLVVFFRK